MDDYNKNCSRKKIRGQVVRALERSNEIATKKYEIKKGNFTTILVLPVTSAHDIYNSKKMASAMVSIGSLFIHISHARGVRRRHVAVHVARALEKIPTSLFSHRDTQGVSIKKKSKKHGGFGRACFGQCFQILKSIGDQECL